MKLSDYIHIHRLIGKLLLIATVIPIIFMSGPTQAQTKSTPSASSADVQILQMREQLQRTQSSLTEKRNYIEQLRKQLKRETDEIEKRNLENQIAREEFEISNLALSFENIALGGMDLSVFDPQQQEQKFNWKEELQTILKPLFQELKDLTDKPRQIERMKSRLALLDNQRRITERALANVERLFDDSLDKNTRQQLERVRDSWKQRLNDIQREREINQIQINVLQSQDDTLIQQIQSSLNEFVTGRGLNLVISIMAFLGTLLLLKGIYHLYMQYGRQTGSRLFTTTTSRRIIEYSYQAFTLLMATIVVVIVLYVLGDNLLLVLFLLLLLFLLLNLRNYIPRFMDETKLLLNMGAVRERERVIYKDLPWMVRSLGVYSKLYNPALDGLLRLPLSEILTLVSRPYKEDEPWFPTKPGDWVELLDGTIGQVLLQTPEIVQLRTKGTIRTYATSKFMSAEPRNFSEGFGVSIIFGVDYQLQSISTTEVPKILRQSVERAMKQSELGEYVQDVLVDFQEAAASSLNYLVYVNMKGAAADSYFAISRMLQRICVDTCNEQGWSIPFNQMTVHAGSGFNTSAN